MSRKSLASWTFACAVPLQLLLVTAAAASPPPFVPDVNCTAFEHPGAQLSTDFLGPLLRITAGNDRFAYRRFQLGGPPDATPLVLIAGYGATMSAWGPTLLHRLALRREVLVFDNIAQGLTEEVQPTEGPISPDLIEQGVLEFLSVLNLTRPHVAGRSLGGCIALKLAAHHPERISKVVSWGGTSPDGRATVGKMSTMKALFNPNNTDTDYIPLNFPLETPAGLKAACRWYSEKHRMPEDEPKPEVNLRYSKGIERALMPWNWKSWRALKHCTVPVLLMGGTEDVLIPPAAQTKLAAHIPGAWLAQLSGGGHGLIWNDLERLVAAVDVFLEEGPTSASGGGEGGKGRSASAPAAGGKAVREEREL